MKMERGAVARFGARGFGVHLNGLVQGQGGPDDLRLWVGKRAMNRPLAPGELDHIVAGGQPHGLSVMENLVKECAEEAAIPEALARQAEPAGEIEYICERPEGLRDDLLFVYDLMLPADFTPRNSDGEVETFYLWPLEKVKAVIADKPAFKFNCAALHHRPFTPAGLPWPGGSGLRGHRPGPGRRGAGRVRVKGG